MAEAIAQPRNRTFIPGRVEDTGTCRDAGIKPENHAESPENKPKHLYSSNIVRCYRDINNEGETGESE